MEMIKKFEYDRKLREYEMKIIKMAGYLADYYIDRAIESDDFSNISSYLIGYFSDSVCGKPFDIGYLISKYKEYGLDEKIEDVDFNVEEWYHIKYEINRSELIDPDHNFTIKMNEEEYLQYMIDKRKKEIEE